MNGSHVKWHSKPKSTQQRGPATRAAGHRRLDQKCHEELVPYSPNNLPPGGFRKVLLSDERSCRASLFSGSERPENAGSGCILRPKVSTRSGENGRLTAYEKYLFPSQFRSLECSRRISVRFEGRLHTDPEPPIGRRSIARSFGRGQLHVP